MKFKTNLFHSAATSGAAIVALLAAPSAYAADGTWGANGNSAWYTNTNWASSIIPGLQGAAASNTDIATFTSAFTGTTVGINMGTNSLNLGAISLNSSRITATNIGNSSATAGVLRLYGASVGGTANTILSNAGTGLLTLQAAQTGGGTMGVVLGNTTNVVQITNTGGITISSIISELNANSGLTLQGGGAGTLTLSGANTFTGGVTLKSGTVSLTTATGAGTSAGTINFNTGGAVNATVQTVGAFTIANPITVTAGSTGTNTLTAANTTTFSGAFTANDNLTISNSGATVVTVFAGGASVASGKTITLQNTSTGTVAFNSGTVITGSGGVATSGAGLGGMTIFGASTYTGGFTLGGSSIVNIQTSSTGPDGNPTNGPFGKGTTASILGTGSIRAGTTADITIKNVLTLAGDVTVATQATEKSLIFTGPATLTGTRTFTANVGTTVAGKSLTFSGAIGESGGSQGLTKAGTGLMVLSGLSGTASNNYSGTTTIANGTLAISSASTANLTGGLTFGASAGSTTVGKLDLTNANATYAGNMIVQTNAASVNNITIGSGKTLATNGNVTIGPNVGATQTTNLTVSGATAGVGSWTVTNAASTATFLVGGATGNTNSTLSTVDLSGLGTFTASMTNAASVFKVGDTNTTSGGTAVVKLAVNNTITAGTVSIGGNSGGGSVKSLSLGTGNNTINANSILIGEASTDRSSGLIDFQNASNGTLTIRSLTGATSTANLTMVNSGNSGGTVHSAQLLMAGHTVDVSLNAIVMATKTNGTGGATADITFDSGTFTANTIAMTGRGGSSTLAGLTTGNITIGGGTASLGAVTMAVNTNTNALTGLATANLNISGGTVTASSINMANAVSTGSVKTATGNINLTGGSLTLGGNITRSNAGGTENATITLNGGTLDMGGFSIGSASAISLLAQTGTLQNVAQINNGAGFAKSSAGTMILSGTNTFTGGVTLSVGTLQLGSTSALNATAGSENAVTFGAASTGTLALAGNSVVIANLNGSVTGPVVTNANGASVSNATLTVGNSTNATGTYAGILQDGTGGGTLALTKAGSGTLVLSGANTHTGATTISAGTLSAGLTANLGNAASNLVFDGGTLQITGTALTSISGIGHTVSFNLNKDVSLDIANAANTFTVDQALNQGTGGFYKYGAGTVILNQTNTFDGSTSALTYSQVYAGTLLATKFTALPGVADDVWYTLPGATLAVRAGGSGEWTTGQLDVLLGNTGTPVSAFAAGSFLGVEVTGASSFSYGNDIAGTNNPIFNGSDPKAKGLVKLGAGTLQLTGPNTYTNSTTITAGTLMLGDGTGNTGDLSATSAISVASGATLAVNRTGGTTQATDLNGKIISGAGSFVQAGSGTTTLSLTNTYTGATTVSAGKLVINGSISTSVLTTVASGATLGGSGTVGALTVNSGGFVTPGNSPGILTVNGDYSQAGEFTAEIAGTTAGSGYDQIAVNGTVDITGGSLVAIFSGSYTANDLLFILLNDSTDAITGTYTGFAQGDTVVSYGGFDWQISYTADSTGSTFTGGNDIALMAVPEPNVAALIGGFGILALLRRRR